MANFRKFHIECLHGTSSQPVADHYPLDAQEVIGLLDEAIAIKDSKGPYAVNEIASIQVRLGQAIPGLECPREIDGPIAAKLSSLDQTFVDWIENIPAHDRSGLDEDSQIVRELLALM
jgi:hypothetical protein